MNLLGGNWIDLLGALTGFVLTLFVFSYVIGDNALFRIAIHIFIGVSAGYAAVVVWYNVIWPQLVLPLFEANTNQLVWLVILLLLSLSLFTKISTRFNDVGSPVIALLAGVGAATVIGGAIYGIIFPQVEATINLFDPLTLGQSGLNVNLAMANGGIILIGTIASLAYFHFGSPRRAGRAAQRSASVEWLALLGKGFIVISFGVIFTGVYAAALAALIERWSFVTNFIFSFFGFTT